MDNQAYNNQLLTIISNVPEEKRTQFISSFTVSSYNPTVAFGLNVFLGSLGADRFYHGQILLGILKLLSFGGLGIWVIIDYFLTAGKARARNIEIARILSTF